MYAFKVAVALGIVNFCTTVYDTISKVYMIALCVKCTNVDQYFKIVHNYINICIRIIFKCICNKINT